MGEGNLAHTSLAVRNGLSDRNNAHVCIPQLQESVDPDDVDYFFSQPGSQEQASVPFCVRLLLSHWLTASLIMRLTANPLH